MKHYEFVFTVCPNDDSFCLPIRNKTMNVFANTIKEATQKFVEFLKEEYFVTVSKTAMTHPEKMYCDRKDGSTEEVGRVYTGSMKIDCGDGYRRSDYRHKWVKVWTEVFTKQNVYVKVA